MEPTPTRQIFLGAAPLATGFRLAGFEVYPGADAAQLDRLLDELRASRTPALVVIDQDLAESDSQRLERVRSEGGRILLTQVPPLNRPDEMHSSVDDRIQQLLGMDGDTA
ncbi:MAG: ATPase [Gammaproteobacteria bacterium]|nr:V-type ATP synthase subunit F [Gammaproteobacteria bacterium]NNJ98238.1 ATPase [Gammaproteobacteria bacterium]